jgi:hypothetical protein
VLTLRGLVTYYVLFFIHLESLTCPPKTDPGRIIGMEDRGKGAGDAQEEAQS